MIHGDLTTATRPFLYRAGTLIVSDEPQELDDPRYLWRVAISADAVAAAGDVPLRGVVYTEAGVLCSYGPVSILEDEAPAGTVWLGFELAAGRLLPQGTYRVGVHFGTDGGSLGTDPELPTIKPAIGIGAVPPATAGPHLWFDVSDSDVPEVSIRNDGTVAATSNAAVFVQPTAPSHPGPYVWVHADRLGDWQPGDPIEITVKDDGGGSVTPDSDVVVATGGHDVNLLGSDPSFRYAATGWTADASAGFTPAADNGVTDDGPDGGPWWRHHGTNTTATARILGYFQAAPSTRWAAAVAGKPLHVHLRTWTDAMTPGSTFMLQVNWYDAGGAQLSASTTQLTLAFGEQIHDWQTPNAPAGAVRGRLYGYLRAVATGAVDVYSTGLRVSDRPIPRSSDGDSPGWLWDGAPGDSSSRGGFGQPPRALHWLEMHAEADHVAISAVFAPAISPIEAAPPMRLDDDNHLVSGPMVLETIDPWEIPDNVSDDYLAAVLPWDLSQRALGETGPIRGTRVEAPVTWVGPAFASIRGAQAIVRSGGPLAHLVGDRIRIRHTFQGQTTTVFVYVTDERDDIPDEITAELLLSYRAFIALANPAETYVTVAVDELA